MPESQSREPSPYWHDRARLERRSLEPRQFARIDEYSVTPGGRRVRLSVADGFDVEVLPDRGLDLGSVSFCGTPLGFLTPAAAAAPPSSAEPESFARRFGAGLLTTCGLDQYGPANVDGDQQLPQHGRASELSATSLVTTAAWVDDRYRLEVAGRMRQWRLFGEDLLWDRRIGIDLGGDTLTIRDSVTNAGTEAWPHMILYHVNFGYPLVNTGARISMPAGTAPAEPRDDWAAQVLDGWAEFPAPRAGLPERVFVHRLDPTGPGEITVTNDALGIEARLTVDPRALPTVFQWVSARAGAYVLGIEPGNTPTINGRADARRLGVLPMLRPGETRFYAVDLTVRLSR